MAITLNLIRHGKPSLDSYSGFPGPGLGPEGKSQAEKILSNLQGRNIRKFYSSDYNRVLETGFLLKRHFINADFVVAEEIRGREKETENLQSHIQRVCRWMGENAQIFMTNNTAILSHCGTINIIQYYLECNFDFSVPFIDDFSRHTPFAGIWELTINNSKLADRRLIFNGK